MGDAPGGVVGALVGGEGEAVVVVVGVLVAVKDGFVDGEGDIAGAEVDGVAGVGVLVDLLSRRLPLDDVEKGDLTEVAGVEGVDVAAAAVGCLSVLLRLLTVGRSTSGVSSSTSRSLSGVGGERGVDDGSWLGLVTVSSFRCWALSADEREAAVACSGDSTIVTSSSSSLSWMRCRFLLAVSL